MGMKKKMKKGIITDGEKDRISNLPESLIHHILSFLLMRDVIRTCLLSKRWRNIWKSIPVLNFGCEIPKMCHEFIDQSLLHYEGQKVKTLQVDLDCWKNARRLESWVRFAATHGVEELDISADHYEVELASCLYECLELRVLKFSLYDCFPQPIRFPLLTELHFMNLNWNYLDTSACPLLEVLIIEELYTYNSLEIYAPNPKLRYLKISEPNRSLYDNNSRLTLYAPNVLHFEFEVSFGRFYDFKDISSVKTMNLYSPVIHTENRMAASLVQLLRKLTHVNSLKLCQTCIKVLAYGDMVDLEIPSLSATCLEFETNFSALVGITSLLRASRCIERLIINMKDSTSHFGKIFEEQDTDAVEAWESLEHALSVELPLNTILIRNYTGCHRDAGRAHNTEKFLEYCGDEIKLVEVLLKSCRMLNKMNISITKPPSQPLKLQLLYGLTKKLLVFPRASPNAEVYFS